MKVIVPRWKVDKIDRGLIGRSTPSRVTAPFQQIAEAGLSFAHEAGYAHIKGERILVITQGQRMTRHIRDNLVAYQDLGKQELRPIPVLRRFRRIDLQISAA